ncbi:MAG: NAD(P)/FAD-dependent oxidoreductase [Rhodospirillaceae bacterium]|nr:NAD(P)/FAD-dependent oxidoreductase [Rhodospirillaceae bacterium]
MTAKHLNRRTLLQSAAAITAAGAATPLRAQTRRTGSGADVLVIGAGLAGLRAAVDLEDQGAKVQVIEGKAKAGGRVLTLTDIPGNPEAGGNGIGAGYGRMIDSAERFGVELVNIAERAPFVFMRELVLDGEIIGEKTWPDHPRNPFKGPLKGMMPWQPLPILMTTKNPLGANYEDWYDPKSFNLDVSMHAFFAQQGLDDAAIELAYNTNCEHGSTAHDVSALMVAFVYSWGNMQRGIEPRATYAAKGGNQRIPEAMAAGLKSEVHYNKAVVGIRSDATGAEAVCSDGTVYRAKKIVCSMPFAALRNVHVDPIIGGAQGQAIRTMGVQLMTQTHIVAKTPYWEKDGLKAGMWTNGLAGNVMAQPFGDKPSDITSLTCWHRGFVASQIDRMPVEDAKRLVIAEIEKLRPAAKGQLEVAGFKSWYNDPFACGDWAIWQPGQVRDFIQSVAKPHGNVHFCGEHLALSNRGMEGAMESGERAAQEVLQGI